MAPPAFGQLQMPALRGVHGIAEDEHGEDSEIQVARDGEGGVNAENACTGRRINSSLNFGGGKI